MKFILKHELKDADGEYEDVSAPETMTREVDVEEWVEEKLGDVYREGERLSIEVRE